MRKFNLPLETRVAPWNRLATLYIPELPKGWHEYVHTEQCQSKCQRWILMLATKVAPRSLLATPYIPEPPKDRH